MTLAICASQESLYHHRLSHHTNLFPKPSCQVNIQAQDSQKSKDGKIVALKLAVLVKMTFYFSCLKHLVTERQHVGQFDLCPSCSRGGLSIPDRFICETGWKKTSTFSIPATQYSLKMLPLILILIRNIIDMNPLVVVSYINSLPCKKWSKTLDIFAPPPSKTFCIAHNEAGTSSSALSVYVLRRMNWLLYQSLKAESLKIPPGAVFVVGAGDWSLTARAEDGIWLTSGEELALVFCC